MTISKPVLQNDLFLRAATGQKIERPPVWLMRQAGRILPQYRKLRASVNGFKALVTNPELAAEVTIQPIDELGVDAAILFSDILVIPECMGLPYEMIEKKGPSFPKVVKSKADIEQLNSGIKAAEELDYVYQTIQNIIKDLDGRVPLIGFAGAPFTIFCYMIEGQGSKTFSKAKAVMYREPDTAHQLLQLITDTTIAYLKKQVESGVDLIQVFDSWAGILSPTQFKAFSLPYIKQICDALQTVPTTVFAKGAWHAIGDISEVDCQVIGLDWTISPSFAKDKLVNQKVFQGNLDPCQLYASTAEIEVQTTRMIQAFDGNHIVNLGHGVYPDTPLDGVKAFVNTVKGFSY